MAIADVPVSHARDEAVELGDVLGTDEKGRQWRAFRNGGGTWGLQFVDVRTGEVKMEQFGPTYLTRGEAELRFRDHWESEHSRRNHQTAEQLKEELDRRDAALSAPSPPYPIPRDEEFGDEDFLESPMLAALADELIAKYTRFVHLTMFRVRYFWAREGGGTEMRQKTGHCEKPKGLKRHALQCDFVIWLAADHMRAAAYTEQQVRASLAHELCHTGVSGRKAITVGHDIEEFGFIVREFGEWKPDIVHFVKAYKQVGLFG